jgi:hypothetical protein
VRLNRTIRKQLRDADGTVVGDVNVAIAANVGEPGGSQTHVSSHSRVVQSTSDDKRSPAAPPQADETKEDA